MNPRTRRARKSSEAGVALLIAIIVLILVSAVALTLMMSAGTESSLASNYRSSTSAYYAAYAGIEEARGRLVGSNPNYFGTSFIPATGLALGQVRYITNPVPGETVAPTTTGNQYFDSEYQQEWGVSVTTATSQTTASVSNTGGYQGPMFKWVRITPATEQSVNLDVDSRALPLNDTIMLFYDPSHLNSAGAADPSLIVNSTPPTTAEQAYEITSLAVMPNGTKKMLQYVVSPVTFNLNLDSALSMPGTVGSFSGGSSANYQIDGTNGSGSAPAVPGCTPGASNSGPAISVSSSTSASVVQAGMPRPQNYTGSDCTYPGSGCVGNSALPSSMSTPASLTQTLTNIEQNSNACLGCTGAGGGTYSYSNIVSALGGSWSNSSDNPEVIYVNGSMDISAASGSGILVVTGNLTYSGNSSWNGIILVVGQGTTTFNVNGGGNGEFNGAIFVAATVDQNGNLLPNFGTADFNVNGGGGSGLFYNSCWISAVQQPTTLRVLSFREISQ